MQNAVFPKWQGVVYSSQANIEHIASINFEEPNLISNESIISDPNFLTQDQSVVAIRRLSQMFPGARILMSFRRHSSYIVSCYRQYLQRGGTVSFDDYFDIDRDRALIRQREFEFRPALEAIETYFGAKPFVFTQEEIWKDLPGLLESLETFVGGRAPHPDEIEPTSYNRSVGYYPAILLRRVNRISRSQFNRGGRLPLYSRKLERLRLDPRSICQYRLGFLPDRPFVSEALRQRIDDRYLSDWQLIQEQIRNRRRVNFAGIPV